MLHKLLPLFFSLKKQIGICQAIPSRGVWMHLLHLTFEQHCLPDAVGPAEGHSLHMLKTVNCGQGGLPVFNSNQAMWGVCVRERWSFCLKSILDQAKKKKKKSNSGLLYTILIFLFWLNYPTWFITKSILNERKWCVSQTSHSGLHLTDATFFSILARRCHSCQADLPWCGPWNISALHAGN